MPFKLGSLFQFVLEFVMTELLQSSFLIFFPWFSKIKSFEYVLTLTAIQVHQYVVYILCDLIKCYYTQLCISYLWYIYYDSIIVMCS